MVLFGDHASNTTAWHPEPAGRGTYSILSACLVTMSLCIYSAIHLNIPLRGEEHLQKYKKIGWVFMGLLAPEIVAFNAWEQRKQAAEHCVNMRKLLGQSDPDSTSRTSSLVKRIFGGRKHKLQDTELSSMASHESSDNASDEASGRDSHDSVDQSVGQSTPRLAPRHQWTMTHSFYTIMGGFALPINKYDGNADVPRLMLSPDWLQWLAEISPDLVFDLSINEIRDKSKASSLAKAIVCGETLWFCIQCAARFGSGLSVTLLELNVFGHALCALIVYWLWWDKPLDIETPTVDERELSRAMGKLIQHHPALYSWSARSYNDNKWVEWHSEPYSVVSPEVALDWRLVSNRLDHDPPRYLQLRAEERLYGFYFVQTRVTADQSPLTIRIDEDQAEDLKAASYVASTTGRSFPIPFGLPDLRYSGVSNWSLGDVHGLNIIIGFYTFKKVIYFWKKWLSFTTAGILFGGIHFCSWTVPLPTQSEIDLWRISAIMIMAAGPLFWLTAALLTITIYEKHIDPTSGSLIRTFKSIWLDSIHYVIWAIATLWFLLYVAARIYIIVGASIAMAYLPPSALETPTWIKYIWHLVG